MSVTALPLIRSLGASLLVASALGLTATSCLGPKNSTEDTKQGTASNKLLRFYAPSQGEASGTEGSGGLLVHTNKLNQLPLRATDYNTEVKGDSRTKRKPEWLLFHSSRNKGNQGSLSIEFEWDEATEDYAGDAWGSAALAFHEAWTTVDASEARYLVMWIKTNKPEGTEDLVLGLHSSSRGKGQYDTGYLSVKEYATGKKFSKDEWTRVAIPVRAIPEVSKVDLSQIQSLKMELEGRPDPNEKLWYYIDNVYFTDAELVTAVENLGYVVRGDGVLMVWDKTATSGVTGFQIQVDGKPVATAEPDQRMYLLPFESFGKKGKQHEVAVFTVGEEEDDLSDPVKIQVTPEKPPEDKAIVRVNPQASHKISPYIFGANFASEKALEEVKLTVNRWGGSRTSKYNWEGDVDSAGADYFFLNGYSKRRGTKEEEKGYYQWIKSSLEAGADVNFVVPIGPWIAKPHHDETDRYCSFPKRLYPEQNAFEPETDCGDGKKPDGSFIWGNDPEVAMVKNSVDHQKKLIESIKDAFGGAKGKKGKDGKLKKGVKFFSLGHEPGLWFEVHRDTVPKGISAEELVDLNIEYAKMVKSVDPDAQVIGYSAWSAVDLAGSNVDYMPPGPDGYKYYGQFADPDTEQWRERRKHGGRSPFEYYLDRMREAEKETGQRLIDAVDVHWYPHTYGLDQNGDPQRLSDNLEFDPVLAEQQMDAVREWYDPGYDNPASWMTAPEVRDRLWDPYHPVIPALKGIIAEHYPGTKLAINEYDTGSRDYYHGALIRAAVLGIFMQEDLYMAQNWYQDNDEPTFMTLVQRMFTNYDGDGESISGKFHKSISSNRSLMSFVAKDGDKYEIVLVNRSRKKRMKTTIGLPEKVSKYRNYVFSETLGPRLMATQWREPTDERIALYVPAFSAVVIVAE